MTFYPDKPLLNIDSPMKIDVYEETIKENGMSAGKLIVSLDANAKIDQIIKDHNVFNIFVYSFNKRAVIDVPYPQTFTYSLLDGIRRTGKIIVSQRKEFTSTFPNFSK